MSDTHIEVWQNCLMVIRHNVEEKAFKTWFEPIVPVSLSDDVLTIQVPNKFFYEWLEYNYIDVLKIALFQELGSMGKLRYILQPISSNSKPKVSTSVNTSLNQELEKNYLDKVIKGNVQKNSNFTIPGKQQKTKIESHLNPNYTFENYVEGDYNQLGRSAGIAIAKKPGITSFNPLVIYGNVGLGKTHLAHAIGNEVINLYPDKNVLFVSSEYFTNHFIESLQNNAITQFINYYQMVDVLIVDDIQFLEGKQKTLDIFFNIFNHLHQHSKQLIFTSDRAPKELGMDERLISRFKWGLCADLQTPSLETRMAIIQQKMKKDGIELPHNVMEYVSYSVRTNIRELEGILISLIAQAALNQREIDIELAREVISKFVDHVSNEISVEFIQKTVAYYYNIPVEKLREKTRKKLIVTARKLSMYLAKQMSNKTLVAIGEYFGGRDHTTVIHACKSIEEMLQNDERFKNIVGDLTKKIKSNTNSK
jgi:chromosomal replication initiator protein